MRWGLRLFALVMLAGSCLYLVYGVGIRMSLETLGAGTAFLAIAPISAIAAQYFPLWRREAATTSVTSAGLVAVNHLLTTLRFRVGAWPALLTVFTLSAPMIIVVAPIVALIYGLTRKPAEEPALASALSSFTTVQVIPVFGLLFATGFLPPFMHGSSADFPAYVVALLFGGYGIGSLVARWLLRHMSGAEITGLLSPSQICVGAAPNRIVWALVLALLGAGTALEAYRGEWLAWSMQAFGVLAMLHFAWLIYRERFRSANAPIVATGGFHLPKLSIRRMAILFWATLVLVEIVVALVW